MKNQFQIRATCQRPMPLPKVICGLLFVLSSFGLVSNSLHAQTQRGAHLVGGQFQLDNLIRTGENLFTAGLSPNYGYFVARNFTVGIRADLQYASVGGEGLLRFSALPTMRYYLPGEDRLRFFAKVSVGGGLINAGGNTQGVFDWDIGPGLDFFINPHVAIEALIIYEGQVLGEDYLSNIGFRVGLQAFIFKTE